MQFLFWLIFSVTFPQIHWVAGWSTSEAYHLDSRRTCWHYYSGAVFGVGWEVVNKPI
jgi:hypothetical protein